MDTTHIPVLLLLPVLLSVRRALELGSGELSTFVISNPDYYPLLEHFITCENAAEDYMPQLATHLRPGHQAIRSSQKMVHIVAGLDLSGYDLIFIDDSTGLEDRVQTISNITSRVGSHSVIAVHDFEHIEYQNAVQGVFNKFIFDFALPYTGILWQEASLDVSKFQEYNVLMCHLYTSCGVTPAEYYHNYLKRVLKWMT